MDEVTLDAQRRDARHVRHLRKRGLVPGNVFGKDVESTAIQFAPSAFQRASATAGRTGVIRLSIEGEKAPRRVMVAAVQRNPLGDRLLHVDLHQVNMSVAVHAAVPLVFVGQSEAVKHGNVLVHNMSEIEIDALPSAVPDQIEVDLAALGSVGDSIFAQDLVLPEGATLHGDGTALVARIQAPRGAEAGEAAEESTGA